MYVVLLLLLPRLPAVGVFFLCPDREQAWRGRIRQAGDAVSTLRSDEKMPQAKSMRRRKRGGEDKEDRGRDGEGELGKPRQAA